MENIVNISLDVIHTPEGDIKYALSTSSVVEEFIKPGEEYKMSAALDKAQLRQLKSYIEDLLDQYDQEFPDGA